MQQPRTVWSKEYQSLSFVGSPQSLLDCGKEFRMLRVIEEEVC